MKLTEQEIQEIKKLLESPKKIVITTHRSPDGDAIGSSLGLYHFLKAKGHDTLVIAPNKYPEFLQWLPGTDKVLKFDTDTSEANSHIENADIIFFLDFNSLYRMEDMQTVVERSDAVKILIDHHPNPDDFPDYALSDTSASSTAELLYEFIVLLGEEDSISLESAECLYTGIMTDTGSFRYASTTLRTHHIAANLLRKGVSVEKAQTNVYDTFSKDRIALLGYALSEKLRFLPEYNTALISLSQEELKRYNYKLGDTEDLVNYGLSVKGMRLSVFIMERPNEIKLSIRSKGDFPVNELAKQHFDGGGHVNAAGGSSELSLEKTIEKFISILSQYKEELNS